MLNRVYAPFLVTTPLILVVNSEAVQAKAKDSDKWAEDYLANAAAGSGPYTLGSYDRGGELVIERNDEVPRRLSRTIRSTRCASSSPRTRRR